MSELRKFEIVVNVSWHRWQIESWHHSTFFGDALVESAKLDGQWRETHYIEARNEDVAREIFFDDIAETDVKDYGVVGVRCIK
jgi:hypothetical protein